MSFDFNTFGATPETNSSPATKKVGGFDFNSFGSANTDNPLNKKPAFKFSIDGESAPTTTLKQETTPINYSRGVGQAPTADSIKNSIVGGLFPSETGLGDTISQIMNNNSSQVSGSLQNTISDLTTTNNRVLKVIKDREANGLDSTKYKKMYNQNVDKLESTKQLLSSSTALPTTSQVVGQLAGTALDIATFGTYGKSTVAMKPFELATGAKLIPTGVNTAAKGVVDLVKNPTGIFSMKAIKNIGTGAGIGYGFDVTQGMQGNRGEDRTGAASLIPGMMTFIGAGIPGVIEGTGSVRNLFSTPKYLEAVKSDWTKAGGDYVKSSKILNKAEQRGKDPVNMLAERGLTPQSMVDSQTGKFNTVEASDRLRTVDTAPHESVLQQSLIEADRGAQPIPVKTIGKEAIDAINSDSGMILSQKQALIDKVNNEVALLENEYKNGITRADSNIEKRKFWQNTKFDRANPIESSFMYQMGRAFKNAIEKATPDVNIQGLNSYLGDIYESAKFLDSLNGKKPVITTGQKIQRGITKGLSTFVGAHLGGGLPGGAAGYIVSNSVSHALESMSNPLKSYFLNKLKVADPQAYTQAVKYLGEKEAQRLSTLRLEAPAPLGSSKNPIINAAPTTYEKQATTINKSNSTPSNTYNKNVSNALSQPELDARNQLLNGGKNSISTQTNMIPINTKNAIPKSISQKKGVIQSAVDKYKKLPNKQGGFVSIDGKIFKEVAEATKKEMIQMIDYLRIGKSIPDAEKTLSLLMSKYNINPDWSNTKIASTFEKLIENTKTSQSKEYKVTK